MRTGGADNGGVHRATLDVLACPLCLSGFDEPPGGDDELTGALRCAAGHSFDLARQGYLNTLTGHQGAGTADSPAMVAARDEFLRGGHFEPIADALTRALPDPLGWFVDAGAGTGWYATRVLAARPRARGLAVDISKHAARRAARAHPRLSAAVADTWRRLPVRDGAADAVLDVFAPRNPDEFARVLRPGGTLVVVSPTARHLEQLRAPLGLIGIDPDKDRRTAAKLEPLFTVIGRARIEYDRPLDHTAVAELVGMGPSARHLGPGELAERIARLPARPSVTTSVDVICYTQRPRAGSLK